MKLFIGAILISTGVNSTSSELFAGWHGTKEEALGSWILHVQKTHKIEYTILSTVITDITHIASNPVSTTDYDRVT